MNNNYGKENKYEASSPLAPYDHQSTTKQTNNQFKKHQQLSNIEGASGNRVSGEDFGDFFNTSSRLR